MKTIKDLKEEKAKEYADDMLPHANDVDAGYEQHLYWKYAKFGHLEGYTQAEQDLSSQLAAYKEALREIINEATTIVIPASRFANNSEYAGHIDIDDFDNLITKAKTLIE